MCVRTTGMFRGGRVPSTPDDDNIRNYMQEAFGGQTRGDPRPDRVVQGGTPSRPQTEVQFEDEYDPYQGTGKTAKDTLRYDERDQSNPLRAARPFSGLTAAQKKNLQERDTILSRKILAAHEASLKGDVEKGAFGFVTDPRSGQVVGFTHKTNPFGLAGLLGGALGDGSVFQAYTGRPEFNPFDATAVAKLQGTYQEDEEPEEAVKPFDPCPEGYVYNPQTESCVKVEKEEVIDDEPVFRRNPTPISASFPDLTRYGRDGGEYLFYETMPGVADPMKQGGPPRGPQGEVRGPGGPKDDLVGPFMLSSQEYVLPYEMVLDEGGGNYNAGIKSLERQRMKALKKYKDRVASA